MQDKNNAAIADVIQKWLAGKGLADRPMMISVLSIAMHNLVCVAAILFRFHQHLQGRMAARRFSANMVTKKAPY
jgi:hypothetical protein